MRKIKTLILIVSLTFVSGLLNAQVKVAQINSEELIAIMPETKLAKSQFNELQGYYRKLTNEYDKKGTNAKNLSETMTSNEQDKLYQELRDIRLKIRAEEKKLEQRYNELMKPILEKALMVVKKVGREQGFSIVIDSSIDSAYLLTDEDLPNLMEAVKKELNIRD